MGNWRALATRTARTRTRAGNARGTKAVRCACEREGLKRPTPRGQHTRAFVHEANVQPSQAKEALEMHGLLLQIVLRLRLSWSECRWRLEELRPG